MTSPAVAPDISSCHQAAILWQFLQLYTAASRLVAGLSPRAPELSSRPEHARLLWTARHRNRFFCKLHFPLISVIPLLLHAHPSVPPPRCTAEQYGRTAQRSERRRLDFRGILKCVCIYRMSQEECAIIRESVPYVKLYRYNPKHLYPKLNGYGDNGQRSLKL